MPDYDHISLGPTPAEEACEQLGPHYDAVRARQECRAFIAQLRRTFGEEPAGARLRVTSNAHDFGTYHEVECRFDGDSEGAAAYAFRCESEGPQQWDAVARAELGLDDADDDDQPQTRCRSCGAFPCAPWCGASEYQ